MGINFLVASLDVQAEDGIFNYYVGAAGLCC